jgi:hypothetical protein
MQDYANQIAQMFVGWQIGIADLPRLTSIRTGQLDVGLFDESTNLNGTAAAPFQITEAVKSWYFDALTRDQVPDDFVQQISIRCDFEITQSEDDGHSQRQVRLDCTVELDAQNGHWIGRKSKNEKGERWGDGPWMLWDV